MPKRESEFKNNQEAISGPKKRKIDCGNTRTPAANAPKWKLAHEDYTVGWICALSTERVAAQTFLDEKHEGPEYVSTHDNNSYQLGRVGKHYVVIAVLPDGEYGTSSAASAARDMLHSFPNVRIGLMVGIGGGAPSPSHDIRLGDIVVSAAHDGKGGVFQYDFGKTIQDQTFRPTGFLDQPPTVLRAAVNGLKAEYEEEGHQLEDAINNVLQKNPRLQKKYKRPDPSTDRLYQSGVVHPQNNSSSCMVFCGDDISKLILRPGRTEDEDNPTIHYGLIASANQLMKDASVRDKLAVEMNVLCFEMEAAGLMNHFPCLVIRGICDYSDTHKNKEWQGYAAMAAAAYANNLLCQIPPNRVEAEKKIVDILSGVLDTVSRTGENVEMMKSSLDRKEDLKILDWLTPIDYGPQQTDYINRRQLGTGLWFLDSAQFQAWVKTSKQTLFCPGIPGAGKTILSAVVINYLTSQFSGDPKIGIAKLYFNFQEQKEQNINNLLASLLRQLAQGQSSLAGSVRSLYQHKTKGSRPLLNEILSSLQDVVAMYSRVFIVVDALDECQVSDGCRTTFLSKIFNLQAKTRANLFATSRDIPEITNMFAGSVPMEIRANNEDLRVYLDNNMSQLPAFEGRSPELQKELKIEIETEIIKAVDGMFLLAQLYLASLDDKYTPTAVRDALKQIQRQTEESGNKKEVEVITRVYGQTMERIRGQKAGSWNLAQQALSWIFYAKRPLTTSELEHALAVNVGKSEFDENNRPLTQHIVSACAGLIIVDEKSNIIRLVHYTTQQYFEEYQKHWFHDAQANIIEICVTYLSFKAFESGICLGDEEFKARLRQYPLYDYAARNWAHHAHMASAEAAELILSFLKSEPKVSASSQAMIASERPFGRAPRQMTGVHLVAFCGLGGAMRALLENGLNPDTHDSNSWTPLSWAIESKSAEIIQLLLAKDVAVNYHYTYKKLWEFEKWTPLSRAAVKGDVTAVELLLRKGAHPDFKTGDGRTPLSCAVESGSAEIIRLLLAKDVPVNYHYAYEEWFKWEGKEWTPLSRAAAKGDVTAVELLLRKGAHPDFKTGDGRTPLSCAVESGSAEIIRLLLAKDVLVNYHYTYKFKWEEEKEWTPLSRAAAKGDVTAVELLLRKGAHPDFKTGDGRTPLLCAVESGSAEIIRLLLAKDVPVNYHYAYKFKEKKFFWEFEWEEEEEWTPLSRAAAKGDVTVVELLLRKGAHPDFKTGDGRTPLSCAVESENAEIIRLLLAKDVPEKVNKPQ